MQLREYQIEVIEQVRQAYRDGCRSPCIVLPCGAGKSIIAAEMARRATACGNRVLYLAHRRELIDQIKKTFWAYGVNMERCTVVMVQTAVRRLGQHNPPHLIVTDENHHCLAQSYRKIYDAYPGAKCVGITATPIRLGGGGLGDVNDRLIVGVDAKWLIKNNYLAPYDYYAPTLVDTDGLHTRAGEFVKTEVAALMKTPKIYGDVVSHYQKLSHGKKAICYCASRAHSREMATEFTRAGIPAVHIDGDTPNAERSRIIDAFRTGEIQILCNVDLISEGFDVPDCNTSILVRPTQSLTLFIQQAMRCMRYMPGKRALIIDHVGNYMRFGLPDMERTWTLDPKKPTRKKSKSTVKIRQCPNCWYTHFPRESCPHCGYVYPVKSRELEQDKTAALQKVEGFRLDFETPRDCKNLFELQRYAKRHGYKPGWAWYQAKARGLI